MDTRGDGEIIYAGVRQVCVRGSAGVRQGVGGMGWTPGASLILIKT